MKAVLIPVALALTSPSLAAQLPSADGPQHAGLFSGYGIGWARRSLDCAQCVDARRDAVMNVFAFGVGLGDYVRVGVTGFNARDLQRDRQSSSELNGLFLNGQLVAPGPLGLFAQSGIGWQYATYGAQDGSGDVEWLSSPSRMWGGGFAVRTSSCVVTSAANWFGAVKDGQLGSSVFRTTPHLMVTTARPKSFSVTLNAQCHRAMRP